MKQRGKLQLLGTVHGLFYMLTGLWPVFSIQSFQLVTGPKTDLWLVKTVGLLISISGGIFLYSAYRKSFPPQVVALAIFEALAIAVVEVVYVALGTIPKIYAADAVIEATFALLWIVWTQGPQFLWDLS